MTDSSLESLLVYLVDLGTMTIKVRVDLYEERHKVHVPFNFAKSQISIIVFLYNYINRKT